VALQLREPSSAAIATSHTAAGTPVRLLPTVVRYPALGRPNGGENRGAPPARAGGPFPLIVFSQGYETNDSAYAWLMDRWTSAGYVVAAPTYPFTAPTSASGVNESDIVNHPTDLRYVISTLLAGSGQTASVRRLFDPAKESSEALAARIDEHYPQIRIDTGSSDPEGYDIVVNATPLGMNDGDPLPMDVDRIAPETFVGEVVMKQQITPFLQAAIDKGCRVQVGSDMLFEQIPAYLEFFGFGTATPEELRAVSPIKG